MTIANRKATENASPMLDNRAAFDGGTLFKTAATSTALAGPIALPAQSPDSSDPMRRDTIFRIASMTKPITAVATMILVEECKLRLDEPVDRQLPELADREVLKRLDGPLDDTVSREPPHYCSRQAAFQSSIAW